MRIMNLVCSLLFAFFSFVYLYIFQSDVLEALHYSLAHGRTTFAPLATALILTVVFVVLNLVASDVLKLRGRYHVLSYIPTFIVLASLTDVRRGVYTSSYSSYNIWLYPLLVLLVIVALYFLGKAIYRPDKTEKDFLVAINYNLGLLTILSCLTLWAGNTDGDFHHEVAIERKIRDGKFKDAMMVGNKANAASRTFSALRAFAMAQEDKMGENIFEYPQDYGADGLFFSDNPVDLQRFNNDSISQFLGLAMGPNDNIITRLRAACYDDQANHSALDYYLTALLLRKDVPTFSHALADFFTKEDEQPKHYREAIVMYQSSHPDYELSINDSTIIKKYIEYKSKQGSFASYLEEYKWMRNVYSRTYWWYHDYYGKDIK